jgi:anti-anti-sigma factor
MPYEARIQQQITFMERQTQIILETIGDVILFDIKGDVTALSEPFLNAAYKKANDQGISKIILKFRKDAYINSGGIALLIQMLAETKKNDQKTAIAGLSDHFKKIFKMVDITKFAKIYDTVEEALKQMSGGA